MQPDILKVEKPFVSFPFVTKLNLNYYNETYIRFNYLVIRKMSKSQKRERRYDLDWLKVIAIILLLYFHAGMVFISWSWYFIQDSVSDPFLDIFTEFLSHWRMPLLFVISGAGTLFAFGYRNGFQYFRERSSRLLIPLAFGMFILIPHQQYFELIKQGWEFSSYLDFKQRFLNPSEGKIYGLGILGNFSWHHLWFIGYLFIYSVIGIPLFTFFRSENGKNLLKIITDFLVPVFRINLLVIPLVIAQILLRDKFSGFHNLVDDGANFVYFFIFFCYGYLICSSEKLWESLKDQRLTSLILAITFTVIHIFTKNNDNTSSAYFIYWITETLLAWFWVLSILGYGRRYLNVKSKLLSYATEGIYPLYIIHQSVLIVVAFYVIQLDQPVLIKFMIIGNTTLLGSLAIYEFIIRRFNFLRVLFGMKLIKKRKSGRNKTN